MKICEYGCGRKAKHQLKNGKWCCSKSYNSCPSTRKKRSVHMKKVRKDPNSKFNLNSYKEKRSNIMKEIWKDPKSIYNSDSYKQKHSDIMKEIWEDTTGIYNSVLRKENLSNNIKKTRKDPNSIFNSDSYREKISDNMKGAWNDPNSIFNSDLYKYKQKLTIEKINEKYPFFSKIEEMRYNPNKPNEKEIQVHCKNHECENSKEKGGWFTPTSKQFKDRKDNLENEGEDKSYFYCSQHCKDTCPLYGLQNDPYKDNNPLPYTSSEIQTLNKFVLDRENGLCEYCGELAEHVHHIRPKKLEPFFALDPDYCVACCEKHHYKYAHKDECSTGNLAKIVCSVESQKFLNQKL